MKWIQKHWIVAALITLLVIGIILWFLYSTERTENDVQAIKITTPSQSDERNVKYTHLMECPDPAKMNTMKVPVNCPSEPNLFLIGGYLWQFDTTQPIQIGYMDSESGEIKNVDWLPRMPDGKFDYFPVGTKEYYVYGGNGQARFTTFVVGKGS